MKPGKGVVDCTMPVIPGQRLEGHCQVCGEASIRSLPFVYEHSGARHYGAGCRVCGSVFLHPMPTDEAIAGLYTGEYYTTCGESGGAHGNLPYTDLLEATAGARRQAARRLDAELAALLGERGTLAEIGCGMGHFMAEMRALGWRVRGLEISGYASQRARDDLGLDVVTGALVPGALPEDAFDACFLGDVLEHLPRPVEALDVVLRSLKPGGVIAVAVPSTLNLLSARLGMAVYRARRKFRTVRIPPYHLFEYRPDSLRRVLKEAGFEVIGIRQSAVPIRRMGLRGTPLENAGKVALQLVAHATSAVCNRGGDRLLALAMKPHQPADGASDRRI